MRNYVQEGEILGPEGITFRSKIGSDAMALYYRKREEERQLWEEQHHRTTRRKGAGKQNKHYGRGCVPFGLALILLL